LRGWTGAKFLKQLPWNYYTLRLL